MKKNIKVVGSVSISTSIILMVIGAFLIKYRNIVISSLVFLLAITVAVLGLALIVRKFRYKRDNNEMLLGLGMLVLGLLVAIFTDEIAQYGLVVIGAIFVLFGFLLIIEHARKKDWFFMGLGIARFLIGSALIILAFTSAGSVQSTFALVTGIVAVTIGLLFLLLEK